MHATPPVPYLDSPGPWLETIFQQIAASRMQDFPLLSPQLSVEAIGFRQWQPEQDLGLLWIGVMLTPWFMNLMLLPASDRPLPTVPPGGQINLILPGGPMPFMAGYESALGHYRICSLFSPVTQFVDQDSARQTALEILALMFPPPGPADAPDMSRRHWLRLPT